MKPEIVVIGGGLAGSEAAWQAAERGMRVLLYEMRPSIRTEAHKTEYLAELVCSNSFKSTDVSNAHGLLKEELRSLGSIILKVAEETKVPAGSALAVDRTEFSRMITGLLSSHPRIKIIREEVLGPSFETPVIVATGPLTSERFAESMKGIIKHDMIYFYDAISPIISGSSIDRSIAFSASRYNKGGADYVNCPMNREEYDRFYRMLVKAERTTLKDFEKIPCFEGCMPIEALADRGSETLVYGPLKPVGFKDQRNGETPYAVVQLRQEDRFGNAYNMVGFQTRMKWPEQRRVLRMIPGLEHAEFLRYGSLHRNTFVNSPVLLDSSLRLKADNNMYLCGQLIGVEGYMESTSMGLIAGLSAATHLHGEEFISPPQTTGVGALLNYVTSGGLSSFQPMNVNWGLLPPLSLKTRDKSTNRKKLAERALKDIEKWKKQLKVF